MPKAELQRAAKILTALRFRKIAQYNPYPKQKAFHALGFTKRERCLLAGNQLGKTICAGNESAYHLTGEYPDWWEGRRFNRPVTMWASNTNNEQVRDGPQKILLGEPGQWGTGTIPRSAIARKPTMARGFPDLVDVAYVKHKTGGVSMVQFKAYDQGRRRWQTVTRDIIWFDEEPPSDIYSEGLARISATGGMVFMTMTPLFGLSDVVTHFYPEPDTPYRGLVMMDIDEALHFDEEERAMIIASYPEHERDARSKGMPLLGSGRVFPIAQGVIETESFAVPRYWPRIAAIDFGYGDHPSALVKLAHDRDADAVYVTHAYKEKTPQPSMHVSATRPWFKGDERCPIAWPHDGHREWGDSKPIADAYREEGLQGMLRTHATFKDGGYSTEAGVYLMLQRMQHGRLKVFSHLTEWWNEFGTYHRKDGQIVKRNDDLLSATRQGIMMLRMARVPEGNTRYAATVDSDWDPFE